MGWVRVYLNFNKALVTISRSILLGKLAARVLDGYTLLGRKLAGWLVPERGAKWSYIQLAADH